MSDVCAKMASYARVEAPMGSSLTVAFSQIGRRSVESSGRAGGEARG
jgi:hypothetical protein